MPDDVLYQDENVCILKPDSPRGVVVFHINSKGNTNTICSEGLLSFNELRRRNPQFGLQKRKITGSHNADHDDIIYFRAPFTNDPTTFVSSFGQSPSNFLKKSGHAQTIVLLKVDPFKTNVFYSQARIHTFTNYNKPFEYYTKPMYKYLYTPAFLRGAEVGTPLWRSEKERGAQGYKNYEVVVKLPHIPPEWFVDCIYNGLPIKPIPLMDVRNEPFVEIENDPKRETLHTLLQQLGEELQENYPDLKIHVKKAPYDSSISQLEVRKKRPANVPAHVYYGGKTFQINRTYFTLIDKKIENSWLPPEKDIPRDVLESIQQQLLEFLKSRRKRIVYGPPAFPVVVSKALRNRTGLPAKPQNLPPNRKPRRTRKRKTRRST